MSKKRDRQDAADQRAEDKAQSASDKRAEAYRKAKITPPPTGDVVLDGTNRIVVKQDSKPSGPDTCRGDSGPVPAATSVSALLDRNAAAVRSTLNPGTPDKCRD